MLKKIVVLLVIGFIWLASTGDVLAQTTKDKSKSQTKKSYDKGVPTSRNPGNKQESDTKSRRSVRKGKSSNNLAKQLDQKVEEFHQRMKENARKRKKLARISQKPQYSDPTYFGHKKKPKKRAPGKKKLCKECKIVH